MKLAIYDFDGTYVNVQTVPHVFRLWKSLGYNKKVHKKNWRKITVWYILHKLKIGWDKETFRKRAMAQTIDLLHHLDDEKLPVFMNQLYDSLVFYVNKDLKEQLKKDKKEGYYTILLSGSFDVMLTPFLKDGFDEVIGTLSRKNNKRLDAKTVQIIIKDKKLLALTNRFDKKQIEHSKAYADSYYDLPLLEYVHEGYCYHPDDVLRKACEVKALHIID